MEATRDISRDFLKTAMETPLLEAEHEQNLARRWKDENDEKALHELTSAYIRLVIAVANKFRNYGLPLSDLVQEGNIGLMQAANRFDPDRGVRFSTYATWWIRSSIQDYVLRNWSIVRTGATVAHKALFFSMRRLRAKINDLNDTLTPEAKAWIVKEMNVRPVDVEHMSARLSGSDRSLNAPMTGDADTEWQDLLPSDAETPEQKVISDLDGGTSHKLLMDAISELSEREQKIISLRKLSDEPLTLSAIGKQIGVSKERVRQIEKQAMTKLKANLEARVADPQEYGLLP